jgi:arylsulfatase A-like enzyme
MVATAAALGAPPASPRPHIVFLLADDLGFYDTALYNPASPTPTLRALAQQGILLDRHYVYRYCSPTRRSFLSGRLPNRITTVQPDNCPLQQGGTSSENICSDFLPLAVQPWAPEFGGRIVFRPRKRMSSYFLLNWGV